MRDVHHWFRPKKYIFTHFYDRPIFFETLSFFSCSYVELKEEKIARTPLADVDHAFLSVIGYFLGRYHMDSNDMLSS